MPTYNINLDKLGPAIRRQRESFKLTREALSAKAQVNYNTIIKLESGANKNPTIKTLIGLCRAFGISIDQLLKQS